MSKNEKFSCPVCGAKVLENPPYNGGDKESGSGEICASCKFECDDFFVDGASGLSVEEYRRLWLKKIKLPRFLKKLIYKNRLKSIEIDINDYLE